jgi:hypothetical protein
MSQEEEKKPTVPSVNTLNDLFDPDVSLSYTAPPATWKKHVLMGKECEPSKPEEYLKSFAVKRT